MINFAKNNQKKFKKDNAQSAVYLGFFKLIGVVICEFLNSYTILLSGSVSDVIKDYIAFGIIADIDNTVASILFSINVEGAIEEANI